MNTVRINGQDYTSSLSDTEIAFIGNLSLPTTAQTLSGAIAEHETDISELNSNLTSLTSNINNVIIKNLGTSFTAEQSADIRAGNFKLVPVGGYWTINGRKYWAAHADYRLHCGDTELTTHHMLVIPDKSLYKGAMNNTNVTTGGYYGSKMKTSGLVNALATIKADFGADHILTHRHLLTNAVANGASSGWAWYDSQIDLMNESMVYGHKVWSAPPDYNTGIDKSQLTLFQARPDLITNRENWWLRDVVSATLFADVGADGRADYYDASTSIGVRPAFLVY